MVVGPLGNKSPDSNRFTLVTPKSENDVRLQATLGNQNPTGLPVGAVRVVTGKTYIPRWACVFNTLPVFLILAPIKIPAKGNIANAFMFLGLAVLL